MEEKNAESSQCRGLCAAAVFSAAFDNSDPEAMLK
jgi:hypothetical protein